MSGGWYRVVGAVVGYVVVFATGFWLSRAGKPYGRALLTAHKLIAVAMLVFVVWSAFSANKASPLGSLAWVVVSLAVVALVALIASGGVLSAMESPPSAVALLHKVVPYGSVLLTAAWLYLLLPGAA